MVISVHKLFILREVRFRRLSEILIFTHLSPALALFLSPKFCLVNALELVNNLVGQHSDVGQHSGVSQYCKTRSDLVKSVDDLASLKTTNLVGQRSGVGQRSVRPQSESGW